MDFIFEKYIDFYGISKLIFTQKWTTYSRLFYSTYISCWWWYSNSRAIDFHSFLDFLLPTYFTYIHPKIWTIFRLSALKFLLSRFYDSLIHSASNYNQKRAKKYSGSAGDFKANLDKAFFTFSKWYSKKIFGNHKIWGKNEADWFRLH